MLNSLLTLLFQGKACFLCEDDINEREIEPVGVSCTKCEPAVPLDLAHGQQLEHCAAHILHYPLCHREHQLCGLCLRPNPQCRMYLKKGQGIGAIQQIDWQKLNCARAIKFQYAKASSSNLPDSPCSNVPVNCPQCGPKTPAIWKYNLPEHWHSRTFHRLSPETMPAEFKISMGETKALLEIWNKRQQYPKRRPSGKNKEPLVISEEHSSRVAFRSAPPPIMLKLIFQSHRRDKKCDDSRSTNTDRFGGSCAP
ncbi:hypothetical protein C8J57DRAFT_1058896 [Mycena rebaudengoi]|nr:hypothetical protein C8J57DRAFT_1058896 [Mycena rebaudengoi]